MASPSWRQSWPLFVSTLGWIPVALCFFEKGYSVATVKGRSMQPTFNPDSNLLAQDFVVLDKLTISLGKYKVGDVVAIRSPTDPSKTIIKRIIGLEGDIVRTNEPYPDWSVRIPKGRCWIEGDEPFHSKDSNSFGPVPLGLIEAKIVFILWPFSRFGRVLSQAPGKDKVLALPSCSQKMPNLEEKKASSNENKKTGQ